MYTMENWIRMDWHADGEFLSVKMALSSTKEYGKTICGPSLVCNHRYANSKLGSYSYITGEMWLGERQDGLECGKITIYW